MTSEMQCQSQNNSKLSTSSINLYFQGLVVEPYHSFRFYNRWRHFRLFQGLSSFDCPLAVFFCISIGFLKSVALLCMNRTKFLCDSNPAAAAVTFDKAKSFAEKFSDNIRKIKQRTKSRTAKVAKTQIQLNLKGFET